MSRKELRPTIHLHISGSRIAVNFRSEEDEQEFIAAWEAGTAKLFDIPIAGGGFKRIVSVKANQVSALEHDR